MLSKIIQKDRLLECESLLLGKDKLIMTGFNGSEYISKLFHFQIEFFSAEIALAVDQLLGKPISFQINLPRDTPRFFHGIIKNFYMGSHKLGDGRNYRAEVVPWLWFLTLTKDCRIYQDKSVKEIITDVFKKFNFSDYSLSDVKGGSTSRLYCVQYEETAFDFISRLMEEEGIFYYFRFEKNKHTLVLSDASSTCKDATSDELLYSSGSLIGSQISQFENAYRFNTGNWTKAFYDFEKPANKLQSTTKSNVNSINNQLYENYAYGGAKVDSIVAKDTTIKFASQAIDAAYTFMNGAGSAAVFAAGTRFKLNAPELSAANGSYLLIQVDHFAFDNSHESGGSSPNYSNSFQCIPAATPFTPLEITVKPYIYGMQTATVVGPSGEEIFADKYGRIKVQFHWDRLGKKDETSSCWIRVAQMWAGKQWGTQYIPRIGQEVVVSFLNGDPDQPLVVGSVYNADYMPPYTLPANITQSGIKSSSSKQGGADDGNEMRFEDKKGEELFYLHAQKDFHRVVVNDDKLEVKNEQHLVVEKNRTLEVTSGDASTTIKKGNYTLEVDEGNQSTTIKKGTSALEAKQSIELKVGSNSITIDTSAITLKVGGNSITIDASGIVDKVGSNNITISQSGIAQKGIKTSIAGTMIEVSADASLKLAGAIAEVDGSGMLKLQGGITMIN